MALALLLGVSVAKDSSAGNWEIVPSVTARTEFDSNLNYQYRAPISDYIFTLAPSAASL